MKKHNKRPSLPFNRNLAEKLIGRIASEPNGCGFYPLRDKFLRETHGRGVYRNEVEAAIFFEFLYRMSKVGREHTSDEIQKTAGYTGLKLRNLSRDEVIPSTLVMSPKAIRHRLGQMRSDYKRLGL